jgi:hypothetical protein
MNDRAKESPEPPRSEGKRRIDSVIPDLLKRAVELGVEKATEAPDNLKSFVNEMKLPKEIAGAILQQVDETKAGLFRIVAKEMRDFLEHTNLAEEMKRVLSSMELEVKATVGFRPKSPGGSGAAPSSAPGEREAGASEPPKSRESC